MSFDQCPRRAVLPDWHLEEPSPTAEENQPTSSRNYGNKIVGPWVVGLYQSKENVRFVIVPDRTAATLTAVIGKYVAEGSVVLTDEWRGYSQLERRGFIHKTVNHSKNFVNPETGYRTQRNRTSVG